MEVKETVESVVEGVQLGAKENNDPRREHQVGLESSNHCDDLELQSHAQDANWPEPFCLLRSLGLLSESTEEGAIDGNAEEKVEELTLKNVMFPSFPGTSGSGNMDPPVSQRALWVNFARLTGRAAPTLSRAPLVDRQEVDMSNLYPSLGFERSGSGLKNEQGAGFDPNTVASDSSNCLFYQKRNGTVALSVLPDSVGSRASKGKEAADQVSHDIGCHGEAVRRSIMNQLSTYELSKNIHSLEDDTAMFEGQSGLISQHEGTNLRELLFPGRQKITKIGKMKLFRKILELVEVSHSQGLALQHLQPSFFIIFPSNCVKYTGSFVAQELPSSTKPDVNIGDYLQRKRLLSPKSDCRDGHLSLASKHQKVSERNFDGNQCYTYVHGEARDHKRGDGFVHCASECRKSEGPCADSKIQLHSSSAASYIDTTSSLNTRQAVTDMRRWEERWYAAPEDLNEYICSFSSNIYSLGVLLFELLCWFDTWEVRSAAMSDLRHRILPPQFLSEYPKEAGYCLLLLHPDPLSRPKAKDILACDVICGGQDLLSYNDERLSVDENFVESDLLLHFLLSSKEEKEMRKIKLVAEIECLQADILEIERRNQSKFRDEESNSTSFSAITPSVYKERLTRNLDKLENAYYTMRSIVDTQSAMTPRADNSVLKMRDRCSQFHDSEEVASQQTDPLGDFFGSLCKYARYSKFEVCGFLKKSEIHSSQNVICSLNFDRDEEFFATAGISKKIKIFEFDSLLNKNVDIHYPLIEMPNKSRLSCVCWNSYIKNYLASTDYEGAVKLWDAGTGHGFTEFQEHRKRAWSVNFCQVDPTKLASGSDDCSVKIWSINERKSVDTITARSPANVCCVQFSPYSSHMLAFGSANFKINCYDLRNTRMPWCTIAGHGKAVSYVRFIDSETLVSASTDNTLKVWNLNHTDPDGSSGACIQTLTGHTNEKNFVGLAVHGEYIACGSETNEIYAYHKSFPMPMTSRRFGSADPVTGQETHDDYLQFVSSVCWRRKSNMVVAANSNGSIEVLQLV